MSGQLQVRYFALARDLAGCELESIEALPADTVATVRARLAARHPNLAALLPICRIAVADDFAHDHDPVPAGSEVLVLPPASGGADRCALQEAPLDAQALTAQVAAAGDGGVVSFIGTVRADNRGLMVQHLEFTAYAPLALRELERICDEATARFGLYAVRCTHRLGRVLVGEAAVVVAVSAAHRAEAFEGCRYVIDELKNRAPIWKKETTDDGSEWLLPTP
jgi:molybdopterin synthase catalytic subunit